MKKRIVVAIFLIFVSIFSFGCCAKQQHPTLELIDVWQTDDGSLVLDIKDIKEVSQECDIEVSFDGGKTWKETVWHYDYGFKESEIYYYVKIDEDNFAKNCEIAVRIAEDEINLASKKSNTIEYYIKNECEYMIHDAFANENIFEYPFDKEETDLDKYIFIYKDDKIILNKYYKENDKSLLMPVKEQDMLDFEYKVFKYEDVPAEARKEASCFIEDGDESTLEYLAYLMYLLHNSSKFNNNLGWKDYNYTNGILKEEFGSGAKAYSGDKQKSYVFISIRIKENDTTAFSDYAVVYVTFDVNDL